MILRANDSLGAGDLSVESYGTDKVRFTFIRDNEFGAITGTFSISERDELVKLFHHLSHIMLTTPATIE